MSGGCDLPESIEVHLRSFVSLVATGRGAAEGRDVGIGLARGRRLKVRPGLLEKRNRCLVDADFLTLRRWPFTQPFCDCECRFTVLVLATHTGSCIQQGARLDGI